MVTPEKRMYDMLGLVSKLDISPTMYKDAIDKYKNIGEYLQEKGINADFYPQGSFSLGTVVRPYKNDKDTNFDLDAICQINIPKNSTSPQAIKDKVEEAFEADDRYKNRLKKYDKCCTIQYAETNEIGFSIDIVPDVDEDILTKRLLKQRSQDPSYIDTSIAITDKKSGEYFWATNNPKGFKAWFEKINKPFLEQSPQQSRKAIFESYKQFFASIEEIPLELERSSLQRVIQILKRHRDVYFSKITNGDKLKPISAIITTIVAYIVENVSANMDISDTSGKKQYGYLKAPLKTVVDKIVDELAKDARVTEAYAKWQELRNEVLRTYMDKLPGSVQLSQQKEFKHIKNMVITEAMNIGGHHFAFEGDESAGELQASVESDSPLPVDEYQAAIDEAPEDDESCLYVPA